MNKEELTQKIMRGLSESLNESKTLDLKENKDHPFIGCEDYCLSGFLTDDFIEEFHKAMEE